MSALLENLIVLKYVWIPVETIPVTAFPDTIWQKMGDYAMVSS